MFKKKKEITLTKSPKYVCSQGPVDGSHTAESPITEPAAPPGRIRRAQDGAGPTVSQPKCNPSEIPN